MPTKSSALRVVVLAGFHLCLAAQLAAGALISVDDPAFGQDSITCDTATGLEWLDLTHSTGQSLLQVIGHLAPGMAFDGFRPASADEVRALWQNAGLTTIDGVDGPFVPYIGVLNGFTEDNYAPAVSLMALVGTTAPSHELNGVALPFTAGFAVSTVNPLQAVDATLQLYEGEGASYAGALSVNSYSVSGSSSKLGTWLVRGSWEEPGVEIPEPTTAALYLLLGGLLVAMAIYRRRPTRAGRGGAGAGAPTGFRGAGPRVLHRLDEGRKKNCRRRKPKRA
jgi:hypothetical protein